jgi:imidazolonepropionase-like amidohydrolase
VIEKGTVLVRDGLIAEVGPAVTIPFDAERIDGDSLIVYAGFIDGLSHAGIPAPPEDRSGPGGANLNRANPTNEQAGIQPDRAAPDLIDPKDKAIEELRKAGFTAAHVVPRGQMLPGSGALVLLAGDDANDMVVKRDVSMFAQIEGANRVYPATPMGVMAKMRQLYREASRRQQIESAYAANATGMIRPEYDPVYYAFFPVIEGDLPVYFYTEDALDIYRGLRLHQTLGFPMVLTGLSQAFESVDLLLDADLPLFLTLDLPELPKKDEAKADSTTENAELPPYDPTLHVTDHTNTDTERINLRARQMIYYREYLSTAASFHNAALNFGFSTKDVKPENIQANLRKMIENGLPEEAALAALTVQAADILEVTRSMGTIDSGKMANLVVATGPLFQEKTKIKYVFVDGVKFEYDLESPPKENGDNRGERPGQD